MKRSFFWDIICAAELCTIVPLEGIEDVENRQKTDFSGGVF